MCDNVCMNTLTAFSVTLLSKVKGCLSYFSENGLSQFLSVGSDKV